MTMKTVFTALALASMALAFQPLPGHHTTRLILQNEKGSEELPHLKEHTLKEEAAQVVHDAEVAAEVALAEQETVLEESNLEAIAISAVIVAALLVPQIIHG